MTRSRSNALTVHAQTLLSCLKQTASDRLRVRLNLILLISRFSLFCSTFTVWLCLALCLMVFEFQKLWYWKIMWYNKWYAKILWFCLQQFMLKVWFTAFWYFGCIFDILAIFIHEFTMIFAISLCGQCCRRHVVEQQVESINVSIVRSCWSICSLCSKSTDTTLLPHLLIAALRTSILPHIPNILCPTTWRHVLGDHRELYDVSALYLLNRNFCVDKCTACTVCITSTHRL